MAQKVIDDNMHFLPLDLFTNFDKYPNLIFVHTMFGGNAQRIFRIE